MQGGNTSRPHRRCTSMYCGISPSTPAKLYFMHMLIVIHKPAGLLFPGRVAPEETCHGLFTNKQPCETQRPIKARYTRY